MPGSAARTGSISGAAPPRLVSVTEGVYAYLQPDGSWWLNNAGLVLADDSILLFDTCATASRTEALAAAIATVSPAPVRYLVNSHEHSDHTHGNSVFGSAVVIAHPEAKAAIQRRGIVREPAGFTPIEVGDLTSRTPDLTFDGRMTLWPGGRRCELLTAPVPAHTRGDVVAWMPESGVLFGGDLVFNGVTPLLVGGSIAGTVRVIEELLIPLDAEAIVPGHGELVGPEVLPALLRYCALVEQIADDAWRRGLPALEAARTAELGEFARWLDAERLVANLHRALAERAGAAPGDLIDVGAAMAETTQLTGRPLLVSEA